MSYSIHNLEIVPDGEIRVNNSLNVTGTANLNAVNVTGNLDVLGNISLNGNNIVNTDGSMEITGTAQLNTLNVTGNTDIDGTLNVEDATTLQSSLDVQGTARLNALNVSGNAVFDNDYIKIGNINMGHNNDVGIVIPYIDSGVTKFSGLARWQDNGTYFLFDKLSSESVNISNDVSVDELGSLILGNLSAYKRLGVGTAHSLINALNVSGNSYFMGNATFTGSLTGNTLTIGNSVNATSSGVGINCSAPLSGSADYLLVDGSINIVGWGQDYKILDQSVLSSNTLGSGVVNSSLTSVGTLSSLTTQSNIQLLTSGDTQGFKISEVNNLRFDFQVKNTLSPNDTNYRTFMEVYSGNGGGGVNVNNRVRLFQQNSSTGANEGTIDMYNGDMTLTSTTSFNVSAPTSNITGNLNVDSNTLYVDATNNQVGIGKIPSNYPLDVLGSIRVSSTTNAVVHLRAESGANSFIYFAEGGVAERGVLGYSAGSGDLVYRSGANNINGGTERMRITSGGNVGIGTTNPSQKLEVVGGTKIKQVAQTNTNSGGFYSGLTFETPASGHAYGIGYNVGGKFAINYFNNDSTYSNFLTIDNSGNVGIGTTNPSTKLDVVGDINTSGSYRIGGTLALTYNTLGSGIVNSSLTSVGTLNNLIVRTSLELQTSINSNQYFKISEVNDNRLDFQVKHLDNSSDTNYRTFMEVYSGNGGGNINVNNRVRLFQQNSSTGANEGTIDMYNGVMSLTSATSFNVNAPSSNISGNLSVKGELVIGTDSLTDNSTIYLTGVTGDVANTHCVIEHRIYEATEKSELLLFKGNDASNPSGPDRIRLRAASISFDTYTSATTDRNSENIRMTIDNSGNVGIGTTQPSDKLHVVGGNILIEYGNYIGANVAYPKLIQPAFNNTLSQDSVLFYTAGTNAANESPKMALLRNGNLGIGTTNPSVALDVIGSIEYTGTITDVSDARVKENITTIDYLESYNKIKQLDVRNYDWNIDFMTETKIEKVNETGLIAQEVEILFPEAVHIKNKYGYEDFRTVDMKVVNMHLIATVKKLQEKIEELENRLNL